MEPQRVLFICTHNASRSQMAEALLRHRYGDRYEAFSAGVSPTRVHPLAVEAMAELGINISGHRATHVNEYLGRRFDYVITVCDRAREICPAFPGGMRHLHWSLPDPSQASGDHEQRLSVFRSVRDEIQRRLEETFG